jgi:protease-4
MVNNFYGQFVHVVAKGRNLPEDKVKKLADGRIYTGQEAKKLGLVDEVGYLEDALHTALDMAGIQDAKVVAYDRGEGYRGSIYSRMPKIPSQINVKLDVPGLANPTAGATFLYLWEPGVVR